MQCPTDGATLPMTERGGIEIDYCPTCRGVWLDRGELDKIIERSLTHAPPAPAVPLAPAQQGYNGGQQGFDRGYDQHSHGTPYKKKRKESWLSELFD